jgi:hypothetical protein
MPAAGQRGSARRHQLTPHLGNLGDGKNSLAVVGLSFIHLPSRAGISIPFFIVFVLPLLLARKLSRSRQRDPRT